MGILSFLIFILLVVGIANSVMRSNQKRKSSPKRMKWVAGGYLIILVVATVLSYTLVPSTATEGKSMSTEEVQKHDAAQNEIFNFAMNGKLHNVEGVFTNKENWTFPFNEKELKISFIGEVGYHITVFVQSKETDDGVVEATHYMGKMIVDGIDFTEKINSPSVRIKEKALEVRPPELVEVTFTKFTEGFVFNQFSGEGNLLSDDHYSVHGSEFILLKVPKSVKVTGDFNYVNVEQD